MSERLEILELAELVPVAQSAAPLEACGVLLSQAMSLRPSRSAELLPRLRATQIQNRLPPAQARTAFELDALAWIATEELAAVEGLVPCGYWHSHPRTAAHPSPADRAAARKLGRAVQHWRFAIIGYAASPCPELRIYDYAGFAGLTCTRTARTCVMP